MRFFKRNQLLLGFVAVLIFCSVMVVRQFLVNQWEHVDLREDFIVLHDTGKAKGAATLYQLLVQELPTLPDRALISDEQRLTVLFGTHPPPRDDLVWKYFVSVQNELRSRTDQRIARALKRAARD